MDYPQESIKPYNKEGKKSELVEEMFDNIAPAYDKLNHTLSMGIDRCWRKKAIRTLRPFHPKRIAGRHSPPVIQTFCTVCCVVIFPGTVHDVTNHLFVEFTDRKSTRLNSSHPK